jgi:hypothetical protein
VFLQDYSFDSHDLCLDVVGYDDFDEVEDRLVEVDLVVDEVALEVEVLVINSSCKKFCYLYCYYVYI